MPASQTSWLPAAQAAAHNKFRVRKESKRGKFGRKRREEVKAVRRKRACLRCSLLRITCSHHDICLPCRQLALVLHAHEKQTLSFSGCIRTMPSEVSIWETFLTSHESQDALIAMSQNLATATIFLEFSTPVTWDLGRLVDDVVDWLNNPMLSETSKVGILSSPQFLDLVKLVVEEDVTTDFQCMIYAISLAYTQPTALDRHYLNNSELLQIGSMAGHKFLKSLDKRLKPQHLKDCSGDELRSLFLLIIGTILAVGYTDLSVSRKDSQDDAQFKAKQSFLCQILAHYVIYLGSQLKYRFASGANQFILQAAPARWHKQGLFQWQTAPNEMSEPPQGLDWDALEAFDYSNAVMIPLNYCHSGISWCSPKTPRENMLYRGDSFQDPTSLNICPSQHLDVTTYRQPVQAHDLNELWQCSIGNSSNLIFDQVAAPSHHSVERKQIRQLCRKPNLFSTELFSTELFPSLTSESMSHPAQTWGESFSVQAEEGVFHTFDNDNKTLHQHLWSEAVDGQMSTKALSVPFSDYEPGLASLWDASRSDKPFTVWQQRGCKQSVPLSELSYRHIVESLPHSPHTDGKHRAQVKPPGYSIASSLYEGRPEVYHPKRRKFNPERRLEVTRIRQSFSCSMCMAMKFSYGRNNSLCQSCSIGSRDLLLANEKRIRSFVPIRTLIPEGSIFPSGEYQSMRRMHHRTLASTTIKKFIPEGSIFSSGEDQSLCGICCQLAASIRKTRLLV